MSTLSAPPSSRDTQQVICWLDDGSTTLPLGSEPVLVGRSPECTLVIDEPLVSRKHARFVCLTGVILLEDLGSANGVFVNGRRISDIYRVVEGDSVQIGPRTLTLRTAASIGGAGRAQRVTPTRGAETTSSAHSLELMFDVANRALRDGRFDDAEHLLATHLNDILVKVQVGRREQLRASVLELAALCATRLASATQRGRWLDYTVDLYSALAQVPHPQLAHELLGVWERASALDANRMAKYLSVLRDRQQQFGPWERVALQRLELLEQRTRAGVAPHRD